MDNIIIISLGGSIIAPGKINTIFLKKFKEVILKFVNKGERFVIYCGGGKIARDYINVCKSFNKNQKDLDMVGILATRLNGELVRSIFSDFAHEEVLYDPTKKIDFKEALLVAAGWKPGWSTDYDSVLLAKNLKSNIIVNLTNVDYVYDKDPLESKDAKPIKKMSWSDFRKLVGERWAPGLSLPFDPIAAKEAEKSGVKVIIMNGNNLTNFEHYLDGEEFEGTVID